MFVIRAPHSKRHRLAGRVLQTTMSCTMRYVFRITAAPLVCAGLAILASAAYAQTDLDARQVASSQRGSTKVQSRLFNPFSFSQPSRLSANPFGLPTGVNTYRANASTLFDPFSSTRVQGTSSSDVGQSPASTTATPISITPIVGGQTTAPVVSAASGFPSGPRPVRSPYRPPPRGPFGP
ncbi:hypothetical protein HG15A2_02000 [Adhaeretor mobilis]|uniref:Uncharacterized protein n=1 Tax=Adhaeretor mobilis TaxID=1930276 RepID=A0A517MPY4_9BACT|nr:hypothetical protein HG15A2_02000 [Adhaeretor mobilis]